MQTCIQVNISMNW